MPKVDIQQENSLPSENSFKVNMQNKNRNPIKQVIPTHKSINSAKMKEKSIKHLYEKYPFLDCKITVK